LLCNSFKVLFHGDATAKLTKTEEVGAGIVGGTLACWNHPFEVARIEAQARAAAGQPALSMPGVMKLVVAESGFTGLFTGLVPRVLLGIWQTLFMVSGREPLQPCCFSSPHPTDASVNRR
jgi:hypothetical protein